MGYIRFRYIKFRYSSFLFLVISIYVISDSVISIYLFMLYQIPLYHFPLYQFPLHQIPLYQFPLYQYPCTHVVQFLRTLLEAGRLCLAPTSVMRKPRAQLFPPRSLACSSDFFCKPNGRVCSLSPSLSPSLFLLLPSLFFKHSTDQIPHMMIFIAMLVIWQVILLWCKISSSSF